MLATIPLPPDTGNDDVDRPFSAFGVLLGFLALTMFAVSSTSRSTTVKPANGYADRAALRRQATLSPFNAAASDSAGDVDSLDEEWLCTPGSLDASLTIPGVASETTGQLDGGARLRLMPAVIEVAKSEISWPAQLDGRTYDAAYDRVVLGVIDVQAPAELAAKDFNRDLSDVEVTALFRSLLTEESPNSRNAKVKSQRHASHESSRFPLVHFVPALTNWLSQRWTQASSDTTASAAVGWDEYAELMIQVTGRPTPSAVAMRISDVE